MDELIAFLAARLDEDEAAARLAAREGGTWTQVDPERHPGSIESLGGPVVYDEGAPDEYQAAHIARHDPARVLRDVETVRAIIKLREQTFDPRYDDDPWNAGYEAAMQDALGSFAATWSDHPDYRQEWRWQ